MALLLENKTYLIADKFGRYVIYKNKTSRSKYKKTLRPIEIIDKYDELIQELLENTERRYYDTEAYNIELEALEEERIRYINSLLSKDTSQTFPILEQHVPNILDSIPKIISRGQLGISRDTVEEVYEVIKKYKIFGEVKDC